MAQSLITRLNTAFSSGSPQQVAALFRSDGYLKDILCLQWDYRAPQTPGNIEKFLNECGMSKEKTIKNFTLEPASVADNDSFPGVPWLMGE